MFKLICDLSRIKFSNRSIKKIEDILEGKTAITSDLDMGNKRILNLPPPRDPEKSTENYNDPVTVKYIYDLLKDITGKIDKRYLKIDGISTLNGRVNTELIDLADPVEYGDAVTKHYVMARVHGLTDIISLSKIL